MLYVFHEILCFQSFGCNGVFVTDNFTDIPNDPDIIVQKYVANPHLINGTKYDLRIHILVTSVNPMRIYIHEEGYVRFACHKYTQDNLHNRTVHLTGMSLNYFIPEFDFKSWDLQDLWNYYKSVGIEKEPIWEQIKDIVIKSILAGEEILRSSNKVNRYNR